MKINWEIRIKSVKFWVALVPSFLLLVQAVAAPFGYSWDIGKLGTDLTSIINTVFGMLTVLGIVVDPTTKGVSDSEQALTYTKKSKVQLLTEGFSELSAELAQAQQDVTKKTDHDELVVESSEPTKEVQEVQANE